MTRVPRTRAYRTIRHLLGSRARRGCGSPKKRESSTINGTEGGPLILARLATQKAVHPEFSSTYCGAR